MTTEEIIKIVRWVGFIPAAVLGLFLGSFVSGLFFMIQGWFIGAGPESGIGLINSWIISSAISAAAFVYVGARVAPDHRKIASLILGALITMLYSSGLVIMLLFGGDDLPWSLGAAVASLVAAGAIIYNFFEHGDEFKLFEN